MVLIPRVDWIDLGPCMSYIQAPSLYQHTNHALQKGRHILVPSIFVLLVGIPLVLQSHVEHVDVGSCTFCGVLPYLGAKAVPQCSNYSVIEATIHIATEFL